MSDSHTYAEAAKILNLPVPWLQKHIKGLPHSKYGHFVRFEDEDIAAIRAMHRRVPERTESASLSLVREKAEQRQIERTTRRTA